ncbi:hypothetical protein [Sphingomonas sp. PB1R3]
MADEHGGIASWAEEIKRSARYTPKSAYERYHAQDPVSYNVENCLNALKS